MKKRYVLHPKAHRRGIMKSKFLAPVLEGLIFPLGIWDGIVLSQNNWSLGFGLMGVIIVMIVVSCYSWITASAELSAEELSERK